MLIRNLRKQQHLKYMLEKNGYFVNAENKFFYHCIFTILPHLVMCEHLRLRVKKEQSLQTLDPFRDGQGGNMSWMLRAAGRQSVQQVAMQLEADIVPHLLDLKVKTQ